MAIISNVELQALQRENFALFVERSFLELNPQTEYQNNWHIEVIADTLEQCRSGKLRRLIINLPPRSLKSHVASIAFPAYLLAHNPSTQIICASYAQDLADKLAGDGRLLMTSDWYRGLFPSTCLANRRSALSDYSTTGRGFRLSTSVGGVLTGRGADFIIVDDPLKPDEALSETQRKTVNDWYDHTLISRLNNKNTGCIILIMQRLHEDDLVGHVLRQGGWKLISFPAIAEQDESYTIQTLVGPRTFTRQVGEALHPERESLELLAEIREVQGEYNFAGQYQQSPSPLGGGMIKTAWFKTYTARDLPTKFEFIFQSWDTANKSSELSDYSVCTTWGVSEKKLYLLDVLRRRLDYPDLRRTVKQHALDFNSKNVVIEDKSSGTQLIQDLAADSVYSATRYQPEGDKVLRMHAASNTIANGLVYLPEKAHWLAEYLHEMASFPKGKHDDQVDSTSQALHWFKQGVGEFGLLDFLKKKARESGYPTAPPSPRLAQPMPHGPIDTIAEQLERRKPAQIPLSKMDSVPCENCGGIMRQRIPGGFRCAQCAHQWLHPDHVPKIHHMSRSDFFKRNRFP